MGQSQQPQQSAPLAEPITVAKHSEIVFTQSMMINKLKNPKMFPNQTFQNVINSSNNDHTSIIDKFSLFNFENCSIYERELPEELFICILEYLNDMEIVKLERVSKNFKNYWLENRFLWRKRLKDDNLSALFMFFKPIMDKSLKSIAYYKYFIDKIRNSQTSNNYLITQAILLGMDTCGKSSFVKSLLKEQFDSNYTPTVSANLCRITCKFNDFTTLILLRDTIGHERYSRISSSFIQGSQMIILCFDLSNEKSFTRMKNILETDFPKPPNISWNAWLQNAQLTMLILGLKRDLPRAIPMNEIEEFLVELVPTTSEEGIELNELKIQYFELSNKTDTSGNSTFPLLFGLLMREQILIEESIKNGTLGEQTKVF